MLLSQFFLSSSCAIRPHSLYLLAMWMSLCAGLVVFLLGLLIGSGTFFSSLRFIQGSFFFNSASIEAGAEKAFLLLVKF